MTDYVHGPTTDTEATRLTTQAAFAARFSLADLPLKPGERVLDLATGVGAMADQLRHRCAGLELVGVDLSAQSLGVARKQRAWLPVLRGDATKLPFANDTFDGVHFSWLLEHVAEPTHVLREVHRVLKPGGWCRLVEVDNASFGTTPTLEHVAASLSALNRAQAIAGGDPFVGQRLVRLLRRAGLARIRAWPVHLVGDARDTPFFHAFVREWVEILEGLALSLGSDPFAVGATQLKTLVDLPGAQFRYSPWVGHAVKSL